MVYTDSDWPHSVARPTLPSPTFPPPTHVAEWYGRMVGSVHYSYTTQWCTRYWTITLGRPGKMCSRVQKDINSSHGKHPNTSHPHSLYCAKYSRHLLPKSFAMLTFGNVHCAIVCAEVFHDDVAWSMYVLILPWHIFENWSTHTPQPNFARPCFQNSVPPYQQSILVSILWQSIIRNNQFLSVTLLPSICMYVCVPALTI